MDFKQFTEKLTPYVNKAREYWNKAALFAEEQIQTTPLFIHTQAEYDDLIAQKRVIILAYDDKNEVAKEIRLFSTIWMTKSFMDNAKIRFIDLSEVSDFVNTLSLTSPLDMRVRYEWQETYHINTLDAIKKWWQSPQYAPVSQPSEESSVDPLAGK
jgi:hypothetical protein